MAATQTASLSDLGRRRRNNEDFAAYFEPADAEELRNSGSLYIVADGVGGAAHGERASQFAAQKLLYEYYRIPELRAEEQGGQATAEALREYYRRPEMEPGERLRRILEQVNDDIHGFAEEKGTRMATTIVAAVVRRGLLYLANVGDSRAYLIRDGKVSQLNRDHSVVGEMVARGEMTEAEAAASKVKNRLTRSLGGDAEVHVDVYPAVPLQAGDKILLCTDGLTRYALSDDLAGLTQEGTPEQIAQRLVHFANEKGGADNVTVVVSQYGAGDLSSSTVLLPRPAEIDELDTFHTLPEPSGPSAEERRLRANLVILGSIALLLMAFTGMMVWSYFPQLAGGVYAMIYGTPTPVPSVAPSTLPDISTATPPLPVVANISETIEAAKHPVTEVYHLTALPAAQTSTPTATPTETATAMSSAPPESQEPPPPVADPHMCLAPIAAGDSLSGILMNYGIGYQAGTMYYRCTQQGNGACLKATRIFPPQTVLAGWQVILLGTVTPDMSQAYCEEKGGSWVEDQVNWDQVIGPH